ncbi:hypothetical protein [Telmatospirillum siberiense]|uniref:hypothetical protein n=1 Tax=Telmatospirillum siberiense TaxID=382514 RepID=UPI0011AEDD13|nr:hypothetical protein [Telmatospirillum siberiense]
MNSKKADSRSGVPIPLERCRLAFWVAMSVVLMSVQALGADGQQAGASGVPTSQWVDGRTLPRSFKSEADKAVIFKLYAHSATTLTYPTEADLAHGASKEEIAFCRSFGEDLRAMRGIKFIEPIARGETIDDPKLRAYWPKCEKLKPDTVIWPAIDSKGLDVPREYYRTKYTYIYYVNFLNENPENDQYVLYVEGVCTKAKSQKCIFPTYNVLYPDSCTLDDDASLQGRDTYENLWAEQYGLSALVSYRGKVWSLSIEDDGGVQNITLSKNTWTGTVIASPGDTDELSPIKHTSCLFQRPLSPQKPLPAPNSGNRSDGK